MSPPHRYSLRLLASSLAMAIAFMCGTANAHHSQGMFEMDKTITLNGTVKVFEWTNPHAWVWITVPNDKGGVDEWGVEMAALSMIRRMGMTKDTFKPGDKVAISLHPAKEGNGGSFIMATFADGHTVGRALGGGSPPP